MTKSPPTGCAQDSEGVQAPGSWVKFLGYDEQDQGPLDIPGNTLHSTSTPPTTCFLLVRITVLICRSPEESRNCSQHHTLVVTNRHDHPVQEVGADGECSCFQMRQLRPGDSKSSSMVTQLLLKPPP